MKKRVWSVVVLMLTLLILAFPVQAATPRLNKSSASIKIGQSMKLKVKNTSKNAKWTSSNKTVVKVSQKGVVTGLKAGKATITAKVGNKKLTCAVKVSNRSTYWYCGEEPDNLKFWHSAISCTNTFGMFVQYRLGYLKYDKKGNLYAEIAIRNMTPGSAYRLQKMAVRISDEKSVLAEGGFSFDKTRININPNTYTIVPITFSKHGATKRVTDLSKAYIYSEVKTN